MSEKTAVQIQLEEAREILKKTRRDIQILVALRKSEMEDAKKAKELAKAARAEKLVERNKIKEEAKAKRIERLQAALEKLQAKEVKKNTNSAKRREARKPSKVTVQKFD